MRIRLWKELRVLMPYWIGLLLVVLVAWFLRGNGFTSHRLQTLQEAGPQFVYASSVQRYATTAFIAAFIQLLVFHLAAVSLFGQEFTYHTMDRLLSQPISRSRIWLEKSVAFLVMALSLLVANTVLGEAMARDLWVIAGNLGTDYGFNRLQEDVLAFATCAAALALASGPLMALLIRQTRTAFLASLVLPVLILTVFSYLDYMVIQAIFGKAFSDWANAYFHRSLGEFNLMILFTIPWFLVVFPLGWLKFKRLEV